MTTMAKMETKLNDDGTVTYWSVHMSQWVANTTCVPDQEYAAMGSDERDQVLAHLEKRRTK